MKIAIMQPYFMPYIGYISLIKHTDRFILFDTAQFIRHGWIERNRILKPETGWQYVQVPLLKFSRDIAIKDVLINNSELWQTKTKTKIKNNECNRINAASADRDFRRCFKKVEKQR